ncbi:MULTISPECIES: NupC/NupG family nucleoside CNT transporter [Clostridium]|uniref:Nucleoside permease n=1 Tax=Clostridium cadaveris TaxID=1529 RepID=A0A1I2L2T5_9CLOT|nr:NupC/NupG family nucleoside CNT transporter [Clostridium cadaveris]MDU4951632.1 NupC/NupG family nucleoside CNT transporter [Clostridium sp.]MDM8311607.1 NupC/NupG family nucleoside CNT transporter [Clostridium cadaveris]NME63531.1 NupC/NupG family nucleoside CNT transporter [Clostridium cadaveris]NWK09804.1 NupC/NupG family nucleoside CNT transporter [Clostridium cadaveris]PWL51442.1 MAG: NupC/NupG family nucleoside CNT transporter [Clostridium cadaveris]
MRILNGLLGISVIFIIAYFMSSDRKSINWRTISIGFLLQLFFAFLVLMSPFGKKVLGKLSSGVTKIIDYANEGINFLFGSVIPKDGGMIFAFQVLTIIIFISSLVAVLYYLGIMQMVVRIIGGGLAKLLGTSQVETLSAAANIFLSQTEAPLLIRPYILRLSTSELFTVMVGGLASVSGSVLVGYNLMGVPLEYLIAASFMAAPAGLIISKIIMPEKEKLKSDESVTFDKDQSVNVIDAAARGASDGLQLALNIGAMLLAFISLIALINGIIGWVGNLFGNSNWSMENLLGYVFYPLALVIGVPLKDALTAGSLIGQKLILNEFVAFSRFGPIMTSLDPKTVAIITFALCGFANISSIAILIGGLGGMEPKRKDEVAKMGFKAVIAGTLANLLSATLAGMFI